MILDTNRDSFYKIKWNRSSRTDKGVHSLNTVSRGLFNISLKILKVET